MRTRWISLLIAMAVLFGARASQAGSIDYLSNQSADFIRTLARNAATDSADAAFYNPAGTAFLRDGLYLNLNTQHILKYYSIFYNGEIFKANTPTPILPTLFAVWKWKNLGVFASFTVPAGGGTLEYGAGLPYLIPLAALVPDRDGTTPNKGKFEGSSMYMAPTIGASYKVFDMISFSAAARLIMANKSFKGEAYYSSDDKLAALDATKKALGVGGIFGIHFRPIKMFDIGVRYETETSLNFETTGGFTGADGNPSSTVNIVTSAGSALQSFAHGWKEKRNLPAMLGLGVACHIGDAITAHINVNYYFIKQADEVDLPGSTGDVTVGYNDAYDNGIEISAALEVRFAKFLLASVGYNRSNLGGGPKTYNDFEYGLSSNAWAGGVKITLMDRLDLNAGITVTSFEKGENASLFEVLKLSGEAYNKTAVTFAFGAQYRLF